MSEECSGAVVMMRACCFCPCAALLGMAGFCCSSDVRAGHMFQPQRKLVCIVGRNRRALCLGRRVPPSATRTAAATAAISGGGDNGSGRRGGRRTRGRRRALDVLPCDPRQHRIAHRLPPGLHHREVGSPGNLKERRRRARRVPARGYVTGLHVEWRPVREMTMRIARVLVRVRARERGRDDVVHSPRHHKQRRAG